MTALVATLLLSPLMIGHSTLAIGMSTTPPLVFDHPYSLLPRFGSEIEPPLPFCIVLFVYCLSQVAMYLPGPIVGRRLLYLGTYCLVLPIVLRLSEDRTTITIV